MVRFLDNPYGENIEERMVNSDEVNFVQESENCFILKPSKNLGVVDKYKLYPNLLSSSRGNLSLQEIHNLINKLGII